MKQLSRWLASKIATTLLLIIYLIPGLTPLLSLITKGFEGAWLPLRGICLAFTALALIISFVTITASQISIRRHRRMQSASCYEHTRVFGVGLFLAMSCVVSCIIIFSPNTLPIFLVGMGFFMVVTIYILLSLKSDSWCPVAASACYSCPAKANLQVCARCGSFACPSHRVCINDEHVVACERCNRIDPHTPHKPASKPD